MEKRVQGDRDVVRPVVDVEVAVGRVPDVAVVDPDVVRVLDVDPVAVGVRGPAVDAQVLMMTFCLPLMLMPPLMVALVPTPIRVLFELTLSSATLIVPEMRMIWVVLLLAAEVSALALFTSTVLPPCPPVVVLRP